MTPGKFRKVDIAGAASYLGTSMNGIASHNYGTYPNSFYLISVTGVNNCQCSGGISEQALTNVKNQIKTTYQTGSNILKNEIFALKKQFSDLNLSLIEEVKKSQQKVCQKQTKVILKAMQKDVSLCAICLEKQRSRVVFPCFHAAYCDDCIKVVKDKQECSICQGKITGDMKIIL